MAVFQLTELPLSPFDANGKPMQVGDAVTVLTVDSCISDLPYDDQLRLQAIVGQSRRVVRFDQAGFVWLGFTAAEARDDFCLYPRELVLA